MISEPTAADRQVANSAPEKGTPASLKIRGLTKMM
jgi:hypothetical protein